jgi:hypothetical protein
MGTRDPNEKLRREIRETLDSLAREEIRAETEARERFVSNTEQGLMVKCSCGLVMSRASFYEHRKETRHDVSPAKERMETCSCGLVMSTANLREHQSETEHTTQPERASRDRRPDRLGRTRPRGIRLPPDFSFSRPDDFDLR